MMIYVHDACLRPTYLGYIGYLEEGQPARTNTKPFTTQAIPLLVTVTSAVLLISFTNNTPAFP